MTNDEIETLPTTLTVNAWTGEAVPPSAVKSALGWALGERAVQVEKTLLPEQAANPACWQDERVGWGLILPERPGQSQATLASGDDAPEPIRRLLQARPNAPVFRYRPESKNRFTLLRNYAWNQDISITSAVPRGTKPGSLPRYFLIYGRPDEIPWQLQFILNGTACVGRLDLEGEALANYVQALLDGWQGPGARFDHAVIWAVDHGASDITRKLRDAIAARLFQALDGDVTFHGKAQFIDGQAAPATVDGLIAALAQSKPMLVVTTSHGQTGPLADVDKMRAQLGLLVDAKHQLLTPGALLASWEPAGAIWYAHACCSAGSNPVTIYNGLLAESSPVDQILKGIAKAGAHTSPLPRALLGAKKPLRAFVGHVEPTFDWTIRQKLTGQHLTENIKRALYDNLFTRKPVGLAFRDYYEPLAALYTQNSAARQRFDGGEEGMEYAMVYSQLAALDIQSTVILGDPTALVPIPLSAQGTFLSPAPVA